MTFAITAQDIKKVKEEHKNPWYIEEYNVLKSNDKVKYGNYKKIGYKNCLLMNGYYKNDKKDSIWTEYFWRTKIIKKQGGYENDKKTGLWVEYYKIGKKNKLNNKGEYKEGERFGVWEFYNREGELVQKYDYDTKELIYFKPDKIADKEYEIKTTNGNKKIPLDRPPIYIGGYQEASKAMSNANLKYPIEAKENETSGTVWISFFVDINGKAINHQVEKSIGDGCDEEALRVVKEIPNNWLPGLLDGKPVIAKYLFPVKFVLN